MTERLARASSRRPRRVVAIWVLVVIAALPAIGLFLGDVLTTDVETTSRTESRQANELLARAFLENRATRERDISEVVIMRSTRGGVDTPAATARVQALAGELRAAGATAVEMSVDGRPLVSRDGDARALLVGLGFDGDDDVPAVYDAVQHLDDEPGYDAAVTGERSADADQGELSAEDLRTGELFFGLPAALVILLAVFGAPQPFPISEIHVLSRSAGGDAAHTHRTSRGACPMRSEASHPPPRDSSRTRGEALVAGPG